MKLKKKEDQSVDASVLLRRENKIIIGMGREREGPGMERVGEGKRGTRSVVGGDGKKYRGLGN